MAEFARGRVVRGRDVPESVLDVINLINKSKSKNSYLLNEQHFLFVTH